MTGRAAAKARVRAVLRAAAQLVDAEHVRGRALRGLLPSATGLSAAGVELALARHVETSASEADLDRVLAWAGEAPVVHVVLSANVFVGAVRALALACAAAERVTVKPSRREPVFVEHLIAALAQEDVDVTRVSSLGARPGDHVHAYGHDASIAAIGAALAPGIRLRGHGTGLGLAVLGAGVDPEDASERLSWDVVVFDQRGCLSPRIVLVEPGADVEGFAEALAGALARRGLEVPRGALDAEERAAIAAARDAAVVSGWTVRAGDDALVVTAPSMEDLALLPTGRNVLVVQPQDAGHVGRLLQHVAPSVTTLGVEGGGWLPAAVTAVTPRARSGPWGEMQRPPLDGPVDPR